MARYMLVTLWGRGWRVPAGIIIDVLVLSRLNWSHKSGRSFSHPMPSRRPRNRIAPISAHSRWSGNLDGSS